MFLIMGTFRVHLPPTSQIPTIVTIVAALLHVRYVTGDRSLSHIVQGGETDFIISVLIGTLLFCEVNSYLFFCLRTGELQ